MMSEEELREWREVERMKLLQLKDPVQARLSQDWIRFITVVLQDEED